MTDVKLDPRSARMLTSREAAKLVGALLGYELGAVVGAEFKEHQQSMMSQEQVLGVAQRSLEIAQEMHRNPTSHFELVKKYAIKELDAVRLAGPIAAMLADIEIVAKPEAEIALTWWTESTNGRLAIETLVARVYGMFLARREVLADGIREVKESRS